MSAFKTMLPSPVAPSVYSVVCIPWALLVYHYAAGELDVQLMLLAAEEPWRLGWVSGLTKWLTGLCSKIFSV